MIIPINELLGIFFGNRGHDLSCDVLPPIKDTQIIVPNTVAKANKCTAGANDNQAVTSIVVIVVC